MPDLRPDAAPALGQLGQSGATIEIRVEGGRRVVVKRADTAASTARLPLQIAKQQELSPLFREAGVIVPRVLEGWDGERYVMEYVSGVPLGNYLATASSRETAEVGATLTSLLRLLLDRSRTTDAPALMRDALAAKFRATSTTERPDDPAAELAQVASIAVLSRLDRLVMRSGPNHGDFTFDNLLVDPRSRRVHAIDLLDSPVETPLIDVGRVLIDAEQGWWMSLGARGSNELLAGRALAARIRATAYDAEVPAWEIAVYKLLAAVRVLPYTASPRRKALLMNVLKTETARIEEEAGA